MFAGGVGDSGTGFATYNNIDYVTIASTGNATDFGDLGTARYSAAGASSPTTGIFAGGYSSLSSIESITIASTGNAAAYGNLLAGNSSPAGCSNVHGGLS